MNSIGHISGNKSTLGIQMLMLHPFSQEFMQNPFYDLGSTSSSMPFALPFNSDVLHRDYTTNANNFITSFPTNTSRFVTSTRIQDESYHETQNDY